MKFIDLFAGLGGTRIGLENALKKNKINGKCVFTSEIKQHAVKVYEANFQDQVIGDITKINAKDIPDFDILLAGFPCQPFSFAGVRKGFADTRGTLFFDIKRILSVKKPKAFLLENVEGLKTHDKVNNKEEIGRTLKVILKDLTELGYKVTWKIIDSSDLGSAQKRKRIYIVGTLKEFVDLENIKKSNSVLEDILIKEIPENKYLDTDFTKKILRKYSVSELQGKHIKDKRGGPNNIHSWDFNLKGSITKAQKIVLEELLKQRRRKTWVEEKPFKWRDGMPLTLEEINTFYSSKARGEKKIEELEKILDDLVKKGYLKKERPKTAPLNYPEGYNIVAGKLSFEVSHILDKKDVTPTLTATDVTRLAIADKKGIRRLEVREGLRLFGFPENYKLDEIISYNKSFDLLGNSVSINVIEKVSDKLIKALLK